MRRGAVALAVLLAVLLGPASASAHPLGNFTINRLTEIGVASDRVDIRYTLDQAEIPTFQERKRPRGAVLEAKRREIVRGLELSVDGRPVRLRVEGPVKASYPPGQGGLPTSRFEMRLAAPAAEVALPGRVSLRETTFAGRVGWRAIVARPGRGTEVRSNVPSVDPTAGLRSYPADLLQSPVEQRVAVLEASPGDGVLIAPQATGGAPATTRWSDGEPLAEVLRPASWGAGEGPTHGLLGEGTLVVLLAAALAWGALHALSPGHGKAMVAAYLVGSRGTAAHALALGAAVTVAHTAGVFLLGLVTLLAAEYVLPEDLYPWLKLASGLLVVAVGAGLLRSRVRWARTRRGPGGRLGKAHGGGHLHQDHSHAPPSQITWRGILGMGASAGLIPCPSALVVLLSAVSAQRVGLGLLLIVAFSAGLAATLAGLGLLVVYAGRLTSRLTVSSRVTLALPAVSTLVILAVGVLLTVQALPQVV